MNKPSTLEASTDFEAFYRSVFLPEHQHPMTIALHVFGTLAGWIWVLVTVLLGRPLLALLFPVIHAVPGLIGHRMFERNAIVGDIRVTRKDYSPLWFIAGNHRMTWALLTKRSLER